MTEALLESVNAEANARVIVDTALAAAEPKVLDPATVTAFVVPAGGELQLPDMDRFLPAPKRTTGTVSPATIDAFVDYVKRHGDDDHTTVWVHPTTGRTVAVLNDHSDSEAAWGDFRAVLDLQHTPEWEHWIAANNKLRSQSDFAEHIEDGLTDIVEPAGAVMLEMAQSFRANVKVTFRESALDLVERMLAVTESEAA